MCLGRLIEVSKHILGKGGAAPPEVKFVIKSDLLFGAMSAAWPPIE
jgi:hypothetical protein